MWQAVYYPLSSFIYYHKALWNTVSMWHSEHCIILHCVALQHGTVQYLERGTAFSFPSFLECFFSWLSPWPVSGFHNFPQCIWWGQCLSAWKGLVILVSQLSCHKKCRSCSHLLKLFPRCLMIHEGQTPETKLGLTVFPCLSKPVNSAKSCWKSH